MQRGALLGARQVHHVAGVGAAASAPHARPPGIRLDRGHHAPSKPQFKTVPLELHFTSIAFSNIDSFSGEKRRQRQYIRGPVTPAEPSSAGARILAEMLHQRGNSVVTKNYYGLFPPRAGV